ncbi:MAG TPA: Gfo/Idh/MocA family oxidoreductase [Gemmataceae bacterium]|jgi:predicted dehydrogenase|nr:Gfo/Idh/MocA family oxidoreductase [Gemmataceae bacterium]
MLPLRGALIGCGYVSQFHLEAWARQQAGRLVAVCDLDVDRARRACAHGVCTAYADAAQLFARERLDFVEICTRPEAHLSLTRLAAEHGVHVLCQKPAAPSLDELREMIAVCAHSGVRLMIHENVRWRAWYTRMKEEMLRGTVGRPFRLSLFMHDQRCLQPGGLAAQPYFARMPRLILYEIGPHAIDLARFFFGEPELLTCTTQHIGPQAGEDVATVTLTYPDRAALLDLSWATAGPHSRPEWGLHDVWLEGDAGSLHVLLDGRLRLDRTDGTSEVLPVPLGKDPLLDSYAATQAHFLHGLETGAAFCTDGADTLKTMELVFAAYDAAARGGS